MSPEQAELSAVGVDTRSDIYSLGVLLYELLTDSTPLERGRLREAGYIEILKRIKEEEPPRPSTRLSASKVTLASVSAPFRTEPASLTKFVRGELDWIVMKALEKDRTRRYETASSFARDIQNFLDDETVEACPPSAALPVAEVRPQAPCGAHDHLGGCGAADRGGRGEHLGGNPGHAGRAPGGTRCPAPSWRRDAPGSNATGP